MLTINTNTSSLFAQNSLTGAQNALATSVQRLSSGLRINNAADDAAGLAISQNLQSQINGVNQSIQCLSDATSLLQVADSSLSSIQDILLKMKGLATQGLDGSLNANQRLDIANQLDDLNSEINATAQRAQFNGIGIISSGLGVDNMNSSIKVGATLSVEAIAVADKGLGHYVIGGSAGVNANLGDASITKSGINSTFQIALDPNLFVYTPGTYVLSNSGNNLTISGNFKGQYQAQTIIVGDAASDLGSTVNKTINQNLNFDQFGISLSLNTTVSKGVTETGAQLAAAIVGKGNYASGNQSIIQINGNGGVVSDIRISGAANGNYQLTKVGTGQIKLTNTSAGGYTVSQTISLKNNVQNAIQTLNFQSMGIAIDVQSYQAQSADQIADALVAVSGGEKSSTLTSAGFSGPNAVVNLDPANGYVLNVAGNSYSTKGTLNGIANPQVGGLPASTTLSALVSWINDLTTNLGVDVSATITSSGSSYALNVTTKGSVAPSVSGVLQSATSSNSALVTASAGTLASTGVNAVSVQTATSKTWSVTASTGQVLLDPVNGFQLSFGGSDYRYMGSSPGATSLADLQTWINNLHKPVSASIDGNKLTLTSALGAANFFTVNGVESQIIGGFTSPTNLIAVAGSGLQLSVGSTTYSTANTFLNQTADGYSSLNDVVDWVNSLNAGVSSSIIGDGSTGYSLGLMQVSGAPASISLSGLRPDAIEANFSSPYDAVTLDSNTGFRVVAGINGSAVFSTKNIPIAGSRADGAVTLSDLADWVNNLNAGLVASVEGGYGSPYTLKVRYLPSNPDLSPITISGIVNGTTSSDTSVALATADSNVSAGIHPLIVTQTAAATSFNLAGFMDPNALVDVSSFRLFVGNGQTNSDGSISGSVYYAYGVAEHGDHISMYLPSQNDIPWFNRALQDNIDNRYSTSSETIPSLNDQGVNGMVTVSQLTDWINAISGVSAYLFTAPNSDTPGQGIDTTTGLTTSGDVPTGDVELHIQGLNTGAANAVGFDNLGNVAVAYSPWNSEGIHTNYTNSIDSGAGGYISGTISLTVNGGIDSSQVGAAFSLSGTTGPYQLVDDPRQIIYDGTSYFWIGSPSDVDPNYVSDPSRGLIDPSGQFWIGQPAVVLPQYLNNPTPVLDQLGNPARYNNGQIPQLGLNGPNPNIPGSINPDGVVNFNASIYTGDPGVNSVVSARDSKGSIDGMYFDSATNVINNAGGTGINLTLTGNTTGSDIPATANIVVDQGISNSPSTLTSSMVSISEGANPAGTIFSINGANYQLDPHNQVTVGDVTYTYHSGTGSANVGVNAAITNTVSYGNASGDGLKISANGPSALEFQSGATSNFHVTVYTSNVMTGSGGNSLGSMQEMIALGNAFSTKGVGNIYGLSALDNTASWQSAFMRLSALVDKANDSISTQRSIYGSQLNTISYNVNSLQSQGTGLQASKSAMMDTNFALETARLAKGQIMQEASTAVATQANQEPSVVLSLLNKSFSGNYNIQNFIY